MWSIISSWFAPSNHLSPDPYSIPTLTDQKATKVGVESVERRGKETEVSKDWPLVPGLPAKTLANPELKQGGSTLEPAFQTSV